MNDNYIVVQSDFYSSNCSRTTQIGEVVKEVENLIRNGYTPIGGIVFDGKTTYQTMLKDKR